MEDLESTSARWIRNRRSVYPKNYQKGEVSKEKLRALFEVAQWAPTHKLTEPWEFRVYHGASLNEWFELQQALLGQSEMEAFVRDKKIAKAKQSADMSQAIAAIVLRRDELKRIPEWEEIAAVASAVQNLSLHASAMGLGSYWSTGGFTNHPHIREVLALKKDDLHLGWFYLGILASESKVPPRKRGVDDYLVWV